MFCVGYRDRPLGPNAKQPARSFTPARHKPGAARPSAASPRAGIGGTDWLPPFVRNVDQTGNPDKTLGYLQVNPCRVTMYEWPVWSVSLGLRRGHSHTLSNPATGLLAHQPHGIDFPMTSPTRIFSTNGMPWPEMAAALPEDGVEEAFPDEEACRSRLVAVRWPDGVTCPKCRAHEVGFLKKRSLYHCQKCQYQFSARVGTIMHNSRRADPARRPPGSPSGSSGLAHGSDANPPYRAHGGGDTSSAKPGDRRQTLPPVTVFRV